MFLSTHNPKIQTSWIFRLALKGWNISGPSTQLGIPSLSLYDSNQELLERLNVQDQASDILGFSIRSAIAQYTASLQTQDKAPDITSR